MRIRTSPVETVGIGDLATFTWKEGDCTYSAYGRVQQIIRQGRDRTLLTGDGKRLVKFSLDKPREVTAVIVDRYTPMGPTLFDLEEDDG